MHTLARTIARTVAGAAGAAAITAGLATGAAQAEPAGGTGAFLLTSGTDAAWLLCSPDSGSHPDPAGACDSIREAHGDFSALPNEQNRVCPFYLDVNGYPAGAWGVWADPQGVSIVDFQQRYGNSCFARVTSGGVFGF